MNRSFNSDWAASNGFSLIEVIVSATVLSLAVLGITSSWKLADDKALAARLEERSMRILAAYAELQNFAPKYLFGQATSSSVTDSEIQGVPLNPGETRNGFLYHPRHVDPAGRGTTNALFDDAIPYELTLLVDSQGQVLRLTYRLPYLPDSKGRLIKEVRVNLRQ